MVVLFWRYFCGKTNKNNDKIIEILIVFDNIKNSNR